MKKNRAENWVVARFIGLKETKYRRARYQDVIAYKERIDAERNKALDVLAEQAQARQIGYE